LLVECVYRVSFSFLDSSLSLGYGYGTGRRVNTPRIRARREFIVAMMGEQKMKQKMEMDWGDRDVVKERIRNILETSSLRSQEATDTQIDQVKAQMIENGWESAAADALILNGAAFAAKNFMKIDRKVKT
jgi:hypothetical protein